MAGRWLLYGLVAVFGALVAVARPSAAPVKDVPLLSSGIVAAVEDPATLRLDDGRRVRLALLEPPASAAGLSGLVPPGTAVALHWPEPRQDRHGRVVAHVVRTVDGLWVQDALVRDGAARVVTFADERAGAAPLLAAEDAARRDGRGVWARPALAPLSAAEEDSVTADPGVRAGRMVVLEGQVQAAALVRGRMFLNFGRDWRTDVTAGIAPADLRRFPKDWRDPAFWDGRRVRLRGWVRFYNGPFLDIDHPERLELLN